MSPNHRSMMVDILSRETHIPIAEIQGGEIPILDVVPEGLEQRCPVYIGCKEDVAKAAEFLNGTC